MLNPEKLGASLYVPATHKHLFGIANGEKLSSVRSLIFCTEDAVSEADLPQALDNLQQTLKQMKTHVPALRFVRVRNIEVMQQIVAFEGAEKLSGFVIPKATRHNIVSYIALLRAEHHVIMPTLETKEVFDEREVRLLRRVLSLPEIRPRILALRIGGNDLLALLGIRRPRHVTIYRTPLGPVIAKLVIALRPYGFYMTAPVFEHIDLPELLNEEVQEDLLHGMIGKTAIHPSQIALIEQHYRVGYADIEDARKILDEHAPAVFVCNGSMCEVATHHTWAKNIMNRHDTFGVLPTL